MNGKNNNKPRNLVYCFRLKTIDLYELSIEDIDQTLLDKICDGLSKNTFEKIDFYFRNVFLEMNDKEIKKYKIDKINEKIRIAEERVASSKIRKNNYENNKIVKKQKPLKKQNHNAPI